MKNKILLFLSVFAIGSLAFAASAMAATSVESVKLTGTNLITIMYSQPVYTSPSDYFGFTGSYAGDTVNSISGSGTATVILTLNNSVPSGATGYLTIGTNVQDVSDQQYLGGATWNIVSSIGPAITGFSLSSNDSNGSFAGTNNTLTASFNTNEQVNVLNMNIDGHSVSIGGSGTGPYSANYTMQSGDSMQTIPVTFTIEDNNNNESNVSFSYTSNGTVSSNTGNAAISSITSNANTSGVLDVGNSITFTLTPAIAEPNAHVTGSYNGVPLSWVSTNNGLNYVATYILSAGQTSQSSPLQISGVTLTDQYGNVSAPASGYDVQRVLSIGGYTTAASVSQVTPVPVTTTSATPSYTFYTNQPGTIVYAGGCSSPTNTAVIGSNTITFNPLANGTYSSCSIAIINGSGIQSGALTISSFTVDATTTTTTSNTNASATTAAQLAALESQLTALESQAASGSTSSGSTDASKGFDFTEFLGVGSQNAQVTALQERLMHDGYLTGSATGYYGSLTEAAVKKYQSANGLDIKGYVGPGTRAALNAGK